MKLILDKVRRVILPKLVRDRLGLKPGSALQVEQTPKGVTVKPVRQHAPLVRGKRRLLVYAGEMAPGFDVTRAIDDAREERIRKLAGL